MKKVDCLKFKDISEFDSNMVILYNKASDVVGSYNKERLVEFKKKIVIFVERVLDMLDEWSYDVDEKVDEILGSKLLELYDRVLTLREKKQLGVVKEIVEDVVDLDEEKHEVSYEEKPKINYEESRIPAIERLRPMGSGYEGEDLEAPSEMRELELDEFRDTYTRKRSRRGSLSVFLAILISLVVIGIILVIKIINV